MTGSNVDHMDVGAYALGVLSDWEATQFEDHLASCATCARELEDLTLVSTLLSHVDGDSIAAVEQYGRDGRALDRMLNVVSLERRRARTRRVLSAAAAIVVVVAGVAFGLLGNSPFREDKPNTVAGNSRPSNDLRIAGDYFTATNKTTGVTGSVTLAGKRWGTEVAFKLTKVSGPLTCELVAVAKDGTTKGAGTWTVEKTGYGTMTQPDPLIVQGFTAFKRADLDHFEVRAIKGEASQNPLVSIPVRE
jgi:hypothetical protein